MVQTSNISVTPLAQEHITTYKITREVGGLCSSFCRRVHDSTSLKTNLRKSIQAKKPEFAAGNRFVLRYQCVEQPRVTLLSWLLEFYDLATYEVYQAWWMNQ